MTVALIGWIVLSEAMLTRIHRKPLTMYKFHASFPICRVLIDYDHDHEHEHMHNTDSELGVGRWTPAAP